MGHDIINAGEAHIGEVGGHKHSATVEFTRPADTTAYAALDVIGVNLAVSGATNATPIVITSATHSLTDGDPVTISGIVGNTAGNGDFFAHVLSATTFSLFSDATLATPVAGNGAYSSGGAVARLFKLTGMGRIVGAGGYVVKGNLMTDQSTCVAQVKVHLFSSPVSAILDNAPYKRLWTNRTKRSGEILFPAMATEGTGSDAAGAIATPSTANSNLPLGFTTSATNNDTAMYFMLETLTVFTPTGAQNFYLRLMDEDD